MATNGTNDALGATDDSNVNNSAASSPSPSRSTVQQQQQQQQHRPAQPSTLRQSYMPPSSPEATRSQPDALEHGVESQDHEETGQDREGAQDSPDASTSLLANYGAATTERGNAAEPYVFRHRPGYLQGYGSFASSYAPTEAGSFEQRPGFGARVMSPDEVGIGRTDTAGSAAASITDGLLGAPKKRKTTHWLARKAGIRSERMMYA